MIKELNRRGFTLVELLAVIAIITLVLGLTSYGVIEILNNSKGSASKISKDGIIEAAKVYGTEKINDDSYWKEKDGDDNKYFCVTIEELFNKGLLKKDSKLPNDIVKTDYVAIKKNSVTSVIGNGTILDSDENNVCTGTVLKEKLNFPSMSLGNIFSDEINVNFSDVTSDSGAVSINKTECLYGDSSGKMTSDNSSIDGHKCSISKLKSGEYYYVRICQTTLKGSYVCSKTEGIKTKKIESPKIDISDTGINIKYSSEGIQNGKAIFSFKSTIDSETNIEVIDSNGSKTKNIVKNEWYKTNQENVFLKYSNKGNGFIYVRTSDGINIEEVKGKFTVHEVIFDRGNADKIGGGTDNITLYCVAKYSSECKIKSPTIEKNNYVVVGWNISRDATSDSTDNWKVDTEKNISSSLTYHPIFTSYVTIKYNTNGGTVTASTPSKNPTNFWKQTSTGLIQKSSSSSGTYDDYYHRIEHGKRIGNTGLPDYNNSNFMNITRDCYSAPSGKEWCLNGCINEQDTFSQDSNTNYTSTNFCDTSKGNCEVILSVNWKLNTYTISYNANGGTGAPSSQIKNCGTNLTLSNTKPTRTGYTFKGWSTSSSATSATYASGGKYTSNSSAILYAVWKDETKPTLSVSLSVNTTWCSGKTLTLTCSDNGSGMGSAVMVDNGSKTTGTYSTSQTLSSIRNGNIATTVTCTDKAGNFLSDTYYYKVVNKYVTDTKSYDACPSGYKAYSGLYDCRKVVSATCSKTCGSLGKTKCESSSVCSWRAVGAGGGNCWNSGSSAYSDNCVEYNSCSGNGTLSSGDCYYFSNYTGCSSGWTNKNGRCEKTITNSCSS